MQLKMQVSGNELSDAAAVAAATAGTQASQYLRPEERIPGWTDTASGTLLDSIGNQSLN